jgi:hypothetical protein
MELSMEPIPLIRNRNAKVQIQKSTFRFRFLHPEFQNLLLTLRTQGKCHPELVFRVSEMLNQVHHDSFGALTYENFNYV